MNRISEITKRDIQELFLNGIDVHEVFVTKKATYNYWGRLEEMDFLKRLYDLDKLPSFDSRFPDAEGDIWQHTVNNDDYPACWIFDDDRFQLNNGTDEIYLRFLCEIFHPAVRAESGYWQDFLERINQLLHNDGYDLYPAHKISNRDVYGWRIYNAEEEKFFIPFSQRNAKLIKDKILVLSIKRSTRNQIYQLLERYNEVYRETNETGWQYDITTSEHVFDDMRQFYIPKCYDNQRQYVETSNLKDFVNSSSPYCVMDAIEFFEKYNRSTDFVDQVNAILKLNGLSIKLENGKIINTFDSQINTGTLAPVQEAGLKELLQDATKYYEEGNYKIAVEKLWDAFERLKSYYSPALDKKKSVSKIVQSMGNNISSYEELFNKEFLQLTAIGNDFRIRHHETTKIDIDDNRHYDYFYKRCLSLISIAIQYLEK